MVEEIKDVKVRDITSVKEREILFIESRIGSYIGQPKMDVNGDIEELKDCVKVISFAASADGKNITPIGMLFGTLETFPDEIVIIEVTKKSPLYKMYKEIITGLTL